MRVAHTLSEAGTDGQPVALAVGSFDGVHLGHAAVIGEAVNRARPARGQSWVLSFHPHPLQVLRPSEAPPLLTPIAARLKLIEALGPDGTLVLPFSRELSERSPEAFVEQLASALSPLRSVVVGPNWRFGRGAEGDVALLRRLGEQLGFEVVTAGPVAWQGEPISSTRVRRAIAEAHFDQVTAMLGRTYTVTGQVIHGRKVGRELGYPTANIVPDMEVLPPHGIFAAWARLGDGRDYPAAAYYGHRPTFPDAAESFSLEVYLFDFDRDLYGRKMEVAFEAMIRPDCDFPSVDELKQQIHKDLDDVRALLRARTSGGGAP